MGSSIRKLLIFLIFTLFSVPGARADDPRFPVPEELEPDVGFWLAVFTDYSTDEGVLHDNRYLGVVYERVTMPADTGRRDRQRRISERREHYQEILKTLAYGKRDGLSDEEQRVLGLWPADVSNKELAAAAGRIRYQQGLAERFRDGLQRAGRWRSHINQSLKRHGVPLELAALPHVESSYNPLALSHVGASGIWQFTRGTGRRFMRVDHVLDERNDPFAASEAAAELLAYNYSIIGNWPMAITAYNHGLAGVRRAMREFGDAGFERILREYRGRTFGFASRNFYVAFVAAMRVDTNPDKYFPGVVPEEPVAYERHTLPSYIAANDLASALGISLNEFASHNPAPQATIWQGSKYLPRGFEVRLPAGRLSAPMATLLADIDAGSWYSSQLPDMFHTVARGDTLSGIARTYSTGVSTLVALNNLGSANRIRAGQRLRLPAAGPAPVVPEADEADTVAVVAAATEAAPATAETATMDAGTDEVVSSVGALPEAPEETMMTALQSSLLSDPSDYTVAADGTIEVHPLETLGHYADWLGIRTQRLRDINGLAFRTPVEVGQRIRLDLSQVDAEAFENRRTGYQRQRQDDFFRQHTIRGVEEHVVARGESVWILALRRYDVPLWLFRQYNPELDLHNVRPGTRVRMPLLATIEA
ncbi:MAG: LysM peptidoglycan-binding domain-containing protein [Woeseia sp.]